MKDQTSDSIITLYQEYIDYIETSEQYTRWEDWGNTLSYFIEFIKTGKVELIEMYKNR